MQQLFIFTKEKTYNKFMKKFEKAGVKWADGDKATYQEFSNTLSDGKSFIEIDNGKLYYLGAGINVDNAPVVFDQSNENIKYKARRFDNIIEYEDFTSEYMSLAEEFINKNGKVVVITDLNKDIVQISGEYNDFIRENTKLVYDSAWQV